jgi:ankyrin repeat protein
MKTVASVDTKGNTGDTSHHSHSRASQYRYLDVVDCLLLHGVSASSKYIFGETPIHTGVHRMSIAKIESLIEHGVCI